MQKKDDLVKVDVIIEVKGNESDWHTNAFILSNLLFTNLKFLNYKILH